MLVVTASAHRQAAFAAADFLMDYLKTRAPFWKKEVGADGAERWVDARDSDDAAAERWQDGRQGSLAPSFPEGRVPCEARGSPPPCGEGRGWG